jgi:chromosomal replication initiator protein
MGGNRINAFLNYIKNTDRSLLRILRHLKVSEKEGKVFLTVPDPEERDYVERVLRSRLGEEFRDKVVVVAEVRSGKGEEVPSGINPRFTFDNFVVGDGNRLAYEVARTVAENPGTLYNPFFLYGKVGIGKTHLLQAIGNYCASKGWRVVYRPAADFSEEMVDYLKRGKIHEFRNRYKEVDVLLLDDVQFLSGKVRTQEELFNIFNHLYMRERQIVLASDRRPKDLKDISDRLISRFEGGVVVEINLDEITKLEIVKRKLQELKITVQENIVQLIVESAGSNVREIEGALKTFKLGGQEALKLTRKPTDLDLVQEMVASYFGVRKEELVGNSRSGRAARARRFAMYLCRKVTGASLIEIARSFGRKDHTTVIHSIKKVEEERRRDRKTNYILSFLETQIRDRI